MVAVEVVDCVVVDERVGDVALEQEEDDEADEGE